MHRMGHAEAMLVSCRKSAGMRDGGLVDWVVCWDCRYGERA